MGRTERERQRRDAEGVEARAADFERVSADLAAFLDRNVALRAAAESAVKDLGLDLAWLAEPTSDGRLIVRHLTGARTELLWELVVPRGWGMTGRALELGAPHWTDDYLSSSTITHHFDYIADAESLGRVIACPILRDGQVIAVLTAATRTPGEVGGVVIAGIQRAAQQAALAATVAERSAQLRDIAIHDDRRHVALELHDNVGALLFSMGVRLRELYDALHHDPALAQKAADLEQQASQAAAALRESVQALKAAPDAVQLPTALRADCRAFSERSGIPAQLVPLSEVPPLTPASTNALVATVREALLNVEKHAHAHSVVVTFGHLPDGVVVAVTDDGVGVDPDAAGDGIGLAAATDRLARVRGQLTISTNEDGGATVRAWVPS